MKYIWFIYSGWFGAHYPVENTFYDTVKDAFEAGVKYGYNPNQVGVEKIDLWHDEETHEVLGWDIVAILINPTERVFDEDEEE